MFPSPSDSCLYLSSIVASSMQLAGKAYACVVLDAGRREVSKQLQDFLEPRMVNVTDALVGTRG